jgi:DNA-binding NtrC family response regulator
MKPKILVVDDAPEARETLTDILEAQGYDIKAVGSGQEAIDLAKKKPFDVALVDIMLPDMEGIKVLKSIKEVRHYLEGIIVTGHASVENAIKAMDEGAFAYLTKPLNMTEAIANIEKAYDKIQKEKELEEKAKELETFLSLAEGRESKELDLKRQINAVLEKLGREKKYDV